MNALRPAPRVAACLVLDAGAPLPPGPYAELATGDLDVVLAPGARLVPGGSAMAAVERSVRLGARDLVVCVGRPPRAPAWAADLVVDPTEHARAQLRRALQSPVVARAVRAGLRLHAWVHDVALDEVRVVTLVEAVGADTKAPRVAVAVG